MIDRIGHLAIKGPSLLSRIRVETVLKVNYGIAELVFTQNQRMGVAKDMVDQIVGASEEGNE